MFKAYVLRVSMATLGASDIKIPLHERLCWIQSPRAGALTENYANPCFPLEIVGIKSFWFLQYMENQVLNILKCSWERSLWTQRVVGIKHRVICMVCNKSTEAIVGSVARHNKAASIPIQYHLFWRFCRLGLVNMDANGSIVIAGPESI